jgi:hypothetical protein
LSTSPGVVSITHIVIIFEHHNLFFKLHFDRTDFAFHFKSWIA